MKLDSKYFDCIRVKPDEDRLLAEHAPVCEWHGCAKPGRHPAPKGRGREGEYFHFCLDHVRQYNKSYNYFDGMSDDEVATYHKGNVTGHRPTWSLGVNAAGRDGFNGPTSRANGFRYGFATIDPFAFFHPSEQETGANGETPRRPIRNAERKCLLQLGLDIYATPAQIKARFKALVKRHHPDSNNGDRGSEEKLREVIQAYNYLRRTGLC